MTGKSTTDVARLFRARRKELGLTQAQAAERAGVAVPTWIRMESGNRCTTATRAAMATSLGWAADAYNRLLAGEDPDSLDAASLDALSTSEGLEQVASILHRMNLTADQIDIIMTLTRRLVEHE